MARRKRTGKATAKRRKRRARRLRKTEAPRGRARSGQDLKARISELTKELRQRTDDLSEALDQQAATSEVLKVISSSPGELAPVFQSMLENATRLCEAQFGFVFQVKDGVAVPVAMLGVPEPIVDLVRRGRLRPTKNAPIMRAARTKQIVHVLDLSKEQAYLERDEMVVTGVEIVGIRTLLVTPMIKDDEFIGSITMFRQEVRPFTEKQIELAANFAAQAVIAIENTRLLSELRESLQQQTATADVLKVISSSPGELEPVFEAILANATRICAAKFGILWLREGDAYRLGALHGAPPAFAETRRREPVIHPGPQTGLGRITLTKQVVHIADVTVDKAYAERDPLRVALVEQAGARTFVLVPMLKEGKLIGAIAIYRQEVRPFTDKQVELVKNFAAQAVIAIENARLLNELRQRTDDLTESLEQQTVTAEILQTINSSPGDLAPVFDAMVESAMRFCQADYGHVYSYDGEFFHLVAAHGEPRYVDWIRQSGPRPPENSLTLERIMSGAPFVHIANIGEDAAYRSGNLRARTIVDQYDIHTMLTVPLRKEDVVLGAFVLYRRVARPFSEKQIELVQNFAAQAVIAMENARLLGELRESLQQQTATADVLKVISRSTFDLQPVLDTLTESAAQLCEAEIAAIIRQKGDAYYWATSYGLPTDSSKYIKENVAIEPGRATVAGRVLQEGKTVHVPDVLADQEYAIPARDAQKIAGHRATLGVPLLREGSPIGVVLLMRRSPKPFTEKQIELVESFADQAVIAIENVRLFDEVQARTRDLTDSLQQQTATADVLKVISRSAFDLQAVLNALIETAARMCDADQGAITREIDGAFFRAASYGYSSELSDFIHNTPVQMDRSSIAGRALVEGRIVQILDVKADPEYTFSPGLDMGDFRTALGVPMLREGLPIGVLALTRKEVRPFTDKQIELITTFADQAAIAIENVRLFKSVEARTRELAASLDNLRATQDRLVQTQKLASLGQLTAGIAHEIKNPLNFVNNFSSLSSELIDELRDALESMLPDAEARAEINELTDTLRGNLDKVVQHGKRADTIVKNMLLHSREGAGEPRRVDVNAMVEESLNLAYHGARAEKQGFNITLERSFDPAAGEADLFPQEITRVLLNLISNGFYAATKRKEQPGGDGREPTLAAATRNLGDRVEISIRDNGTGIAPDVREKMFNPFFTTKPAGEGTGLGLSISHDIVVKQHSGAIEVDTQRGEFTEIRVILPRNASFART